MSIAATFFFPLRVVFKPACGYLIQASAAEPAKPCCFCPAIFASEMMASCRAAFSPFFFFLNTGYVMCRAEIYVASLA